MIAEREDILEGTKRTITRRYAVDMKYANKCVGVIIWHELEHHADYANKINFRLIIDLKTGYVLAKVAEKDVSSVIWHMEQMQWKREENGRYVSRVMNAEINSKMRFTLVEETDE